MTDAPLASPLPVSSPVALPVPLPLPLNAKRILHIIGTLDPAAGGPSESVRVLLSFGPIGYTGEVVTLDDPAAPFLKDIPFPVHALGPVSTTFAYSPKLLPWLRANRHRFDGVVVNGLWDYCGLAAWLAVRRTTPYVVFSHGMLDPYFKHAFPLKHAKKWLFWVVAQFWILRRAYRVLFTTTEEARLAERSFWLHQWNGLVVPYGAQRPPEDVEAMRAAFEQRVPEVRGKRFILFLGRIHRKKGCDLLVNAFLKIAALDPELHLLMAGPDQQGWSATLKADVEAAGLTDRVHWPGMITGGAKWGSFFCAEVFALPSHQENFGIAVAEALGCGLPVLLADKVNIAPEIAADHAGYMETDTQEGTDALLRRWVETPDSVRATMRAQARATFETRYDMRKNAVTIIELFGSEDLRQAHEAMQAKREE